MADMTITLALSGNVGGRRFSYSSTSTVADVDAAMFAQAGSGAGLTPFTPQSYGGLSAVVIVPNSVGLNVLNFETTGGNTVYFFVPAGLPAVLYNSDGFNGSFGYSTTATDGPTNDPTIYGCGAIAGHANYRAIAALKAIS